MANLATLENATQQFGASINEQKYVIYQRAKKLQFEKDNAALIKKYLKFDAKIKAG